MNKIELQIKAVRSFSTITDQIGPIDADLYSEAIIKDCGDTLALFVWREVREAEGDPAEAIRMMRRAIADLENVITALEPTL